MPDKNTTPESRAEISRRNGAKSKGPVSAAGKANSARNSLKHGLSQRPAYPHDAQRSANANGRHGLLARTVVLPNESRDRFVRLLRTLLLQFQPANAVQCHLVETMAVARWRQLRVWGLEKAAIGYELRQRAAANLEMAAEDDNTQTTLTLRDFTAHSRYLEHISQAETRFDRQYDRALRRLLSLRNLPHPEREAA